MDGSFAPQLAAIVLLIVVVAVTWWAMERARADGLLEPAPGPSQPRQASPLIRAEMAAALAAPAETQPLVMDLKPFPPASIAEAQAIPGEPPMSDFLKDAEDLGGRLARLAEAAEARAVAAVEKQATDIAGAVDRAVAAAKAELASAYEEKLGALRAVVARLELALGAPASTTVGEEAELEPEPKVAGDGDGAPIEPKAEPALTPMPIVEIHGET